MLQGLYFLQPPVHRKVPALTVSIARCASCRLRRFRKVPIEPVNERYEVRTMIRKILPAAIASFAIVAFANHATASCGSSQRVSAANSWCLEETHSNGRYSATNHCLHEIKVKIDIRNASDKTRTILGARLRVCTYIGGLSHCINTTDQRFADESIGTHKTTVTGTTSTSWGRRIRSVTCCKDHSSCNRRSSDTYPPSQRG